MIRKLKSGEYRLYTRKVNPKPASVATSVRSVARGCGEHERELQYLSGIERAHPRRLT